MIQIEAIGKSYAGQPILRDLSWRIPDRERIGLVGPNGAGKTTLCRLLAGVEEPDEGRIVRPRETTVGYGDLQHRFEALGGYRLETEANTILSGLGFRPPEFSRPLSEFSGGWRMRAMLARLLLQRPSLLLLDEPTNHLDIESLEWLESFLADYEGTVVIVSHDRYFLNRMVTSIAELAPSGLTVYPGDYDEYLVQRQARRELLEAQARNQAKRIAEIERFIERFRYQASKARQVQSRVKMLDRIDRMVVEDEARVIRFSFPQPPRTGRRVATLKAIHKAYGDNVVYAGVDFEVERGAKIALVGPNGAGKSTLLRMLAGALAFDRGERTLGAHVAVHYYAQHQLEALTPTLTVFEELERAAPEFGQTRLRTILGTFLFSGDAVEKKISVLSGGEKARVALAKMLVRPAALLCLDEPTNHLDLASREVLESALAAFPGTIVFISHDRYFINRIATGIVEVARGTLVTYLGTYDDYLDAKARATAAESSTAPAPRLPAAPSVPTRPEPAPRANRPEASKRTGKVAKDVRELRRRLEDVERQIHALEARLAEIGERLGDPAFYADSERVRAVAAERKSAEEQVTWLMREWEQLSTALAAHE